RIQVEAQDWEVFGADDRRLLSIPRASVELSLSALLEGQVAPTRITLRDLRISLLRRADGSFALGREQAEEADGPEEESAPAEGEEPEPEATEQSVLRFLFAPLADKPDPSNPFAQLANVSVLDASAVMVDQRLGVLWRAPFVDLQILRDLEGVVATGSATVALGEKRSRLGLTMTQVAGAPGLETVVDIESLEPAALASVFEGAQALESVSGSLSGRVGMTIDEDGRPSATAIEIAGESLTLDLPEHLERPLVFRDLRVEAHGEGLDQSFVLDRLSGSVAPLDGGPGPTFSASAVVEPRETAFEVEIAAELGSVPAAELALYWPKGVGGNGRPWVVENVTGGAATSTTLAGTFTVEREGFALRAIESFGGRFLYEDLEVHYLRPMPPLTGATGSAVFDLDGLDFTIASAAQDNIAISNGGIAIFGLTGEDHRISIVFQAAGPLREALGLLDHERLGLLDNMGIEPQAASGSFQADVEFAFPLVGELGFDEIQIGVEGKIADAALEKGVAGYDLGQGQFDLVLDSAGVTATGTATLAGVPLQATWSESFESVEFPTRVKATAPRVEVSQLATFGLDAGEYLQGALSATLDLAANYQGDARIGVTANLQEARAALPPLGWEKPAGQPGELGAVLTIEDDALVRVEELSASLGDDELQGEVLMAPGGGFERVSFERLRLGRNAVQGLLVTPYLEGGYAISVRSGQLDLAPLLGDDGREPAPEDPAAPAERSGPPYTPLRLEAPALSRVRLGEGRALENVSLDLERDERGWQLIRAQAQVPRELWRHENRQVPEDAAVAGKTLSVFYRPEGGLYRFELFADDIGAALRALDWVDSIEGGEGAIVGTLPGPLPDAPLNARLETRGFRLVDAPAMAKLLTVASLTGIGNVLSGEGIEFDRAVGEFALDDDMIRTPLFRAYGSSLGITAKGQIDLEADRTDVAGTLVPAYSVNRILGEIPIIGQLLTGGEGEGILGVTYRVTGRIEDPEVSVNPLSILAPGFLRGLFGVGTSDTGEPEVLTDVFPSGEVGR
ncbi:MAG: AsmA-like C-terminal domain-containing protein, partial [Tistlia sp.]